MRDGTIYPLEIKKSAAPSREDAWRFQGLVRLKLPLGPGGIICLIEDILPLAAGAQAIPVAAL